MLCYANEKSIIYITSASSLLAQQQRQTTTTMTTTYGSSIISNHHECVKQASSLGKAQPNEELSATGVRVRQKDAQLASSREELLLSWDIIVMGTFFGS
jgi:hypothetical protein